MYLVQCFEGIGDLLSQRHFIRRIAEIKGEIGVFCTFPQLFWDIPNLKFWFKDTTLRVQAKNLDRMGHSFWWPIHRKAQANLTVGYDDRMLAKGMSMAQSFAKKIEDDSGMVISDYELNLPLKEEWLEAAKKIIKGRQVCIVRPPTVRREWQASARNPQPGLIQYAIDQLPKGVITISVSDNQDQHEWSTEKLKCNEYYDNGELPIEIVIALMKLAIMVITPVGYACLAGPAVGAKTLVIFGGHVPSSNIYDKRINLATTRIVEPDDPCACFNLKHACIKDIAKSKIDVAIKELLLL